MLGSCNTNFTHENMTNTYCMELCKGQNHTLAGTTSYTCCCTSGVEENDVYNVTRRVEGTLCQSPCPGDDYQTCGDIGLMSLYDTGKHAYHTKACQF